MRRLLALNLAREVLKLENRQRPRCLAVGKTMLSVGRELRIHNERVACQSCLWEGVGAELSTGLAPLTPAQIYLYVYRCPACGRVELARKGKMLQLRPRRTPAADAQEDT